MARGLGLDVSDLVEVYTDGGCTGNPGPGGWAYVVVAKGEQCSSASGGEKQTTNNRMELTAVIRALEDLSAVAPKVIYTDSQYVRLGITQWIPGWIARGWRTASKAPVKNKELWMRLDELAKSTILEWRWVKGHNGNEFNELCDHLVEQQRRELSD